MSQQYSASSAFDVKGFRHDSPFMIIRIDGSKASINARGVQPSHTLRSKSLFAVLAIKLTSLEIFLMNPTVFSVRVFISIQTGARRGPALVKNKREAEASQRINTPPKPDKASHYVLNLSKLAHREGLKRSLVGVGGLEVRGRQCLTLT